MVHNVNIQEIMMPHQLQFRTTFGTVAKLDHDDWSDGRYYRSKNSAKPGYLPGLCCSDLCNIGIFVIVLYATASPMFTFCFSYSCVFLCKNKTNYRVNQKHLKGLSHEIEMG